MDSISHFLFHLFRHVSDLGPLAYGAIFLLTFIESFAFFGALVPGTPVVVFLGFLASKGEINIYLLIVMAIIGGILGDAVSYYLGTKGTRFFSYEKKILNMNHLDRGKRFFAKYGDRSIFLSRFVGPIRPIVPFIAGLAQMDKKVFLFWNVTSSIVWSLFYVLLGYHFGNSIGKMGSLWNIIVTAFRHIFF